MKKNLRIVFIFLLVFGMMTRQVKSQVDTSTTEKLINYILQDVDKNQVPTGYLREAGAHLLPMQTFNGSLTDSNRIDINLWRVLYFQLQTSYVGNGSNPLPTIATVNTTIKNNDTGLALPIPMPLLIGSYNTVDGNAFNNNLLYYNSSENKVYDVANRSQSPYVNNTVFAACAVRNESATGTDNFIIPNNLVYNSTGKTISQVSIDFNNGLGFTNISIGTAFSAVYSDTGYKRWTIKISFTDNSQLQCYQDYYVLNIVSSGRSSGTTNFSYTGSSTTEQFIIPPTSNYAGGIATIVYSNKGFSGTLRKPLIVIEGYDLFSAAKSLQPQPYSFSTFIDAISIQPGNQYDFNHQLDDIAGYDLVFLTFFRGTDDIKKNALVVEELIRQVNSRKENDDRDNNLRQKNVVMGLSVGGLSARYGLAQMTRNNEPTETRLLITHDSPHRGANIPLGLQYFVRMLGSGFQIFGTNVTDILPEHSDMIKLFDEPASQQIFLYRATGTNSYNTNTFLDGDYRNMVDFLPSDPNKPNYRFIATSLGSECGHELYSPYKTFFNAGAGIGAGITANFLFFRVPIVTYELGFQAEAHSLPNQGSTNKLARLYVINNLKLFGFIDIVKQFYNNTAYADGNTLPVDGVPGSTSGLLDVQALRDLSSIATFPPIGLYVQFPIYYIFGGYFNAYAYNAGFSYNFSFVPATSALDISPFNTSAFSQSYVNGFNQNYPSKAETYIAQETITSSTSSNATNNEHIRFTARNSEWLYNEMENLNNNLNCSSECSNPYYIGGKTILCTSETYSIPGRQRGATVTWSASPLGIVNPGCIDCNSTTLTKASNGIVTLTATLNACNNFVVSQPIAVGLPDRPKVLDEMGEEITIVSTCTNTYKSLCPTVDPKWNILEWEWEKVTGNFNLLDFESCADILGFQPGNGFVSVRVRNACGWSNPTFIVVNVTDCSGMTVQQKSIKLFPNPATSSVTLSVDKAKLSQPDKGKESLPAASINEVKIYDNFGSVKLYRKFTKQPTATLDISGLPKGVYVVEVNTGNGLEHQPLLIQK